MNPKLRPVDVRWVRKGEATYLMLRDPLGLSDKTLLVPQGLGLLLALCDGTRDKATLLSAFQLRSGIHVSLQQIEHIVEQLDSALLLSSPRFDAALAQASRDFRTAPFRPPALAGAGYPASPLELRGMLEEYGRDRQVVVNHAETIRGLVSPHIDYHRGGPVYAETWAAARKAIEATELVIVLGTDHAGGSGSLTPTRQSYATPLGVLPTEVEVVDQLANAIGHAEAYQLELNHRKEHSIELALVWLHYILGGRACPIVPVLCGSFEHFVNGVAEPTDDQRIQSAVDVLASACRDRRTIVVAAADLAHVGPAFGDAAPFRDLQCEKLAASDADLLETLVKADADAFLTLVRSDGDARRICGLPPIYVMLRLLSAVEPNVRGEVVGYAQCPADEDRGSWVTIGGLLYRDARPGS